MNTLQDILGELLFQVKARQSDTIDSEDVENAILEANRFFDSIGVVIAYLNDDLGIVSNEICDISNSDDWCNMSKMNWYVNRPLYRDSVNFNISVATALTSPPSSFPSS